MNPIEAELCHRLARAQSLGDHAAAGAALFELGQAAKHGGDLALATQRFGGAVVEFRSAGQGRNLLAALNNVATAAMAQGDWTAAMRLFHECLDLATQFGDGDAMRRAVGNLASLCSDADQVEDALTYDLMAVGMAQQLADAGAAARALHNATWACIRLGLFGRAQEYMARAGIYLESSNELEVQATVALMQARLDMRARRWERARMEMIWSDRVLDTVGTPEWRSHALIAMAILDELTGLDSPVTDRLMTALPNLHSVSGRHTTARRLLGLSYIAAEQGRTAASQSYAGLAAICADGSRDPSLSDIAGQIRDALSMGEPVCQAAADHASVCALELQPGPGEAPMPPPPLWRWLSLS